MKKNIIFIATVLYAFSTSAQKKEEYAITNIGYWTFNDMFYKTDKEKEKIANAKIIGYNETLSNGKRTYLWQTMAFDKKGNCTSTVFKNHKGKVQSQYFYTYNSENKAICMSILDSKGKEINKINRTYDKFGNIAEIIQYKNGKESSRTVSTYDSTRVLESYYYKKGSKVFYRKWVYTYYPDKSKKFSVIYNADGNVLYTWNYECRPDGQLASKHKDTTEICKNEELDKDGNKVITYRRFNEKGIPVKVVRIMSNTEKMLQFAVYYDNNKLNYCDKYNRTTGALEEIAFYYKNGKEKYKYIYTYDDNNNQTSYSYFKKGELIYKSVNVFNNLNFLVSTTRYKNGIDKQNMYKFNYLYSN